MNIENLILAFGYAAIFVLMITNGILSLPSSQFIYVTAGFLVPSGKLDFFPIVIIGTIGNTIGNILLYEASRRKGIGYIARWKRFSTEKITRLHYAFEQRGPVIIFIGKFLPLVKVIIPIVAGIASMNRALYCTIIAITSFVWALGLTYFGVSFGEKYDNGTFWWVSASLLVLSGFAIYAFQRYIKNISVKGEISVSQKNS